MHTLKSGVTVRKNNQCASCGSDCFTAEGDYVDDDCTVWESVWKCVNCDAETPRIKRKTKIEKLIEEFGL